MYSLVAPWWFPGGSSVLCRCGSRPFFLLLSGSTVSHYLFCRIHFGWHFLIFLLLPSSFVKSAPRPRWEAQFRRLSSSILSRINQFCGDSSAGMMAMLVSLFALIVRLVVRFAVCSLFEFLQVLVIARDLCTFSFQNPFSKNDCMYHTCNFESFVCHLLYRMHFGW